MILNSFLTAYRNLLRRKQHAIINISGLAVALAACLIIFLVLQHEYSYNKNFKGYSQIYRLASTDSDSEGEQFTCGTPFPTLKAFKTDYPRFVSGELMQNYGCQITLSNLSQIAVPERKFIEKTGTFFADSTIAEIFEFNWIRGNAQVLNKLDAVALSRKTAERLYGSIEKALGQTLNFDNEKYDLRVEGIFEDLPDNCDFPFLIVGSYISFKKHNATWPLEDWGSNTSSHQIFLRFPEGTNTESLSKQLAVFEKKHNTQNRESTRKLVLNPMKDFHYDSRFESLADHQSSKTTLMTLSFIGVLILLMASINFINLSTALAVSRSREVGVRKVLGGTSADIRFQIIIETLLVVSIAMSIGIALAAFALPFVKHIMMVQTKLSLFSPGVLVFLVAMLVVTTLLSGFYPAFVMGSFNPVNAIKNKIATGKIGSVSLRRALVIIQFSFSQVFIIATLIAVWQMDFIRNTDLGFKKESVLMLQGSGESTLRPRFLAFKNELLARTDVKNVSICFDAPSSTNSWQNNFAYESTEDKDFSVNLKFADQDYLKTFGVSLVAGKMYEYSDTAKAYLVNETFLKKVGVLKAADAIGKMVRTGGRKPKPICGVVKDFHTQSLKVAIPPLLIMPSNSYMGNVGIKLSTANISQSRKEIKAIWNKYFPELVFSDQFLDESIAKFYAQEEKMGNLYKVYALFALFISSLGLYGLVSYLIIQKNKEIGIRKLLGADVLHILFLFFKEFAILIGIAFLIAAPVSGYFMHQWLMEFAYKIELGPTIFLVGLFFTLLAAAITVGFKTYAAAVSNPVLALKTSD